MEDSPISVEVQPIAPEATAVVAGGGAGETATAAAAGASADPATPAAKVGASDDAVASTPAAAVPTPAADGTAPTPASEEKDKLDGKDLLEALKKQVRLRAALRSLLE